MPISSGGIAAIGAASSILGPVISGISQGNMNRKTREWNMRMYSLQRQNSLQDWYMQNQYNSPEEQMRRLKRAGLNPNLVYGNGATQEAAPFRSPEPDSWNPRAPEYDFSGIGMNLMQGYDAEIKQAQADNLKVQNDVLEQQKALIAAQIGETVQRTDTGKFNLGLARQLEQTSLEAAIANLNKTYAETGNILNRTETDIAMRQPNLQKAIEEILNYRENRANTVEQRKQIRAATKMIYKDIDLKNEDLKLKRQGIQPHDKLWQRIVAEGVQRLMQKGVNLPTINKRPQIKFWEPGFQERLDSIRNSRR